MNRPFNPHSRSSHQLIQELRRLFLETEGRGSPDYWSSPDILALYDATLARRIAWKWDAVLDELAERNLVDKIEECSHMVDWGTGSGVAVERLFERFEALRDRSIQLRDRSAAALHYASEKIAGGDARREIFSTRNVFDSLPENSLLLVSHVLSELPEEVRCGLITLAKQARTVLWVEAGTHFASRALVAVREALLATHLPLAPCLHAKGCGLLAPERNRDWCHSFAKPPAEIFTDGDWVRLARELKIDLRSLPVSFLFAVRDGGVRNAGAVPELLLGRARFHKGGAQGQFCGAKGICDRRFDARKERGVLERLEAQPFYCQIPEVDAQ